MSVLVHSCRPSGDDSDKKSKVSGRTFVRHVKFLNVRRCYFTTDDKFLWFKPIPLTCSCRKKITSEEASVYLMQGKALRVYKPQEGELLSEKHLDFTQIVMHVDRTQTPRVDLITSADIERAYVYDRNNPRAVAAAKEYAENIEAIHLMILEERVKLIVPFKDDPDVMYDSRGRMLHGRLIFPFGPDQRTAGGHA